MSVKLFNACLTAVFAISALGASAEKPVAPPNLLPEGTFEILNEKGEPETWSIPHPSYQESIGAKFELVTEGESKFARLSATQSDKAFHLAAEIPLPENTAKVTVSYRVRCRDIVPAATPEWASVRLGGGFAGEGGSDLGYLRISKSQRTATAGWVTVTDTFDVPAGAKTLKLQPGIFFCTGSADFDDFTVTCESAAAIPATQP